ncbi:tRNA (adenine(37)-N6)-methyltransferase-like [Homalodisca vitripennis]|uniref:tRNA (adenine(37)-N6)-methyltransferase-like n=1 Tax=Homalodisca vitripennis TaxID=197043 RepID=UPI001EEA76F1|nr:tRNA (adenine(37)-N6)-methyltransferase-like [Homalodisca vitripennis]
MAQEDVDSFNKLFNLQKQLSLARTEINNLRREIKSLKFSQSKEISHVKTMLESWKCSSCQPSEELPQNCEAAAVSENGGTSDNQERNIELQPIGIISTGFVQKRAIPRQPNVNSNSLGKVSLFNYIFTNPEHSLEGLDGFSHMWILFYFHQNQSNHIRAKVAPPRLNGSRVGVFGTRSPHRPCPIGLSLVQINKVEGSSVYFSGVDMLDGTPVLDLKPYIPHYDNPVELNVDWDGQCGVPTETERLELDGQESDPESAGPSTVTLRAPTTIVGGVDSEREAPDGEEGVNPAASLLLGTSSSPLPAHRHIRVPDWISQSSVSQLQVMFTPQAENILSSLQGETNIQRIITDVLREDPRSVYLRDRYANQFYTFLINNYHVSCKFDDNNHIVKVFRIVSAGTLCECGHPEWQCSTHGGSIES